MLVAQSSPTLCDLMNCSLPGCSVHGILQARTLEWAAIPFLEDLPDWGIEPGCRQILYHLSHQGSPPPLNTFIQLPPGNLPLVTTNLVSFTMSLFVCFWRIIDLHHCVGSWCTTMIWYFYTVQNDHHESSYHLSLKILNSYWLYSPHCTFHTCDLSIL